MAVFAHPDDESFGIGGTLARYGADPTVRVVLVCATRGEAGEVGNPQVEIHEPLGRVRERELRCACRALGIEALHFLGYRDSGMAGSPDNQNPHALIRADFNEAVGRIVAHIRRERPAVVVTFDERGGYGHPDHVAIHHYTTAAFEAAADANRYPEQIEAGLQPHQAQKLYYTALPARFFRAVAAKMEEMGIPVPARYRERLEKGIGLPDEACMTQVDVRDFWEARQAAIRCHATQLNPDSVFALLPPEIMRDLQRWECFQLARSTVGEDGDGHDLLVNIR